nr:MAG TPA: hypothetical protein [Caudoviricetes sp.]
MNYEMRIYYRYRKVEFLIIIICGYYSSTE